MQELVLKLPNEFIFDNPSIILEALKKEKEQIMDSYLQGSFDDGPNITNSEQYYNQTYNQKQHIIDIMKADEDDGLYDLNK